MKRTVLPFEIEYPVSSSFPVTCSFTHINLLTSTSSNLFFQLNLFFPFLISAFPSSLSLHNRTPSLSKTRRPSLSLPPSRFSKISHQLRTPPRRNPPLCTRNLAATPPCTFGTPPRRRRASATQQAHQHHNEGTINITKIKFLPSF